MTVRAWFRLQRAVIVERGGFAAYDLLALADAVAAHRMADAELYLRWLISGRPETAFRITYSAAEIRRLSQ